MKLAPLPPSIKGWCPSALQPMETGDGFLVRLHLSGGEVSGEKCAAIGQLARTYGNGLIDLSQRGNLQLRGVKSGSLRALTSALYGFGLIGQDAASDAFRNVIGSPLAGLDPGACIDGSALVRELEAKLAASPDLKALPGKFCFLIDDGGRLSLDAIAADVRLIGVGGRIVLAIASGQMTFTPVALKEPSEAVEAAIALARAFLALCGSVSARRMEQLVLSLGAAEVARAAGMTPETPITALARRVTEVPDVIGLHDGFTGAAAPFGRLHAGQMDVLAALAPHGLRLTPWRSVLLPCAPSGTLDALKDAGLIVSPEDPRLAIAACPGAPACASAQVDTRHAAESLAPLARAWAANGITLHMSGCAKGCASAAPAPITLIGRDGAYDLLFDGRAGDEPLLRGLDLKRAQAAIEEARMRKAMA